ncbi:deoxyribonuclease-2-beta [Pelobates cultripes]|uniref:deoxyribonuclease II n=1 Tax=Pelobates cultripes TaxID=61616 RepID=A0AAD1WGM6_PELCU|nr:deoxyribonuclease-2-beta [Pelobates cultripes]
MAMILFSFNRFVLYKLPKYNINESAGSGLNYLYLDSMSEGWQPGRSLINMTESAVGRVLEQLYRTYRTNSAVYMMYNDAPPSMKNYTTKLGHSKGILLFDKSQGFWLIHSVPRFPPFPEDGYGYPSTGQLYGQSAICVTYKYQQFKEIAIQMFSYNPNVYNCSIPEEYWDDLWGLQKICLGSHFPWVEPTHLITLESANGDTFLSFAKSKYFVDDIFTGWIAQTLGTDILTETWQPRGDELPSNCSLAHHVFNIKRLTLPSHSSFYSSHDHSKWCVSRLATAPWTCIGDLNRNPSQIWRSGGFICTQNKFIYNAFSRMVSYYKACIPL